MDISRRWLCNKFINSLSLETPKLRRRNSPGTRAWHWVRDQTRGPRTVFPNLNGPHLSQVSAASSAADEAGPGEGEVYRWMFVWLSAPLAYLALQTQGPHPKSPGHFSVRFMDTSTSQCAPFLPPELRWWPWATLDWMFNYYFLLRIMGSGQAWDVNCFSSYSQTTQGGGILQTRKQAEGWLMHGGPHH